MSAGAAMVLEALAERLRPKPPIKVSQWLAENLVLVDGPSAGRVWSAEGAPYLLGIADCLGDEHPANLVTVRKSEQTGVSILALGWALYVADREPANMLYAAPGIDMLRDLNSGKLQPLIDAWQRRAGRIVVEPQTSRSATGSTTYEKVFQGGRLWLANANSAMELSSKTAKKGVKDELSKWEDIPGYGDPETLFFGRFTAFRRRENWKILEISTPEIDSGDVEGEAPGHCRIDRSFKRSDQRFWHVPCPQCGDFFVHEFKNLDVNAEFPEKTTYTCPSCGYPVSDAERPAMIRAGEWRATASGPGRHPGFHVDAFCSLMMSYEAIGRDWLKAKRGDEEAKKDFSCLKLGVPYLYKGDAPDHKRLMERREEGLMRGRIPPRGLVLVAAADVQMRGIWFEVVAFAENRESWVVEALYLDGSTEGMDGGAFEQLGALLDREWPDAFGRMRRLDALAVDSGYRSHIVYAWVRQHQRMHPDSGRDVVLSTKGWEGWGHPAIGTPSLVDINLVGKKVRQGAKVWPVGTWPLKGAFYGDLGKSGVRAGASEDPSGYCHFGDWLDENYFKQITAESLEDETFRGRKRKVWKQRFVDNHFLDCRVYNLALANYLGLSAWTPEEIAGLKRARGMPEIAALPLFVAAAAVGEGGVASPSPPTPLPNGRGEGAAAVGVESDVDKLLDELGKRNDRSFF